MRVRADELADLVDEEVEAEAVGLLVEPRLDLVGEVLDRDRVRRCWYCVMMPSVRLRR